MTTPETAMSEDRALYARTGGFEIRRTGGFETRPYDAPSPLVAAAHLLTAAAAGAAPPPGTDRAVGDALSAIDDLVSASIEVLDAGYQAIDGLNRLAASAAGGQVAADRTRHWRRASARLAIAIDAVLFGEEARP
jgi:hypothetical protein